MQAMFRCFVPAMLLVAALGSGAQAQPAAPAPEAPEPGAELPTDRPGFNAPATVVGRGVVQIEMGWSTVHGRDGLNGSVGPQPLLRIGATDHLEFEFTSAGLAAACVIKCDWHGTDIAAGARYVLPVTPLGISLAMTGLLSVPTGSQAFTSEHLDPLGIVHVDRAFGPIGVSYNYIATRIHDEDGEVAATRSGHGLNVGTSIGRWAPFVNFGWRPVHVDGRAPVLAEAGLAYRLARDVQLDVSATRGLNAAEAMWSLSAGIVLRHRPR
ncbi:hypothetical protein TBR22_A11040 [Luteitalea sp. TBR-22]|uniref:transporter n=1 Tax=Luteitalea sp. TBR-22 TaxID=2802971 RepID=UPI001AFBD371|nr:transporter [Luteitalea sp. TBR-22]BCS31901.1 hypothetical protein TBR22_A11040 [Luteitalea sp. TBR-22]